MTNIVPIKPAPTLEELIEDRCNLKESIDKLNQQLNELKEAMDAADFEILIKMDELGVQRTGTTRADIVVSESTMATAEDWDAFNEFVKENDAFHLYQKRISATAYQEYLNAGEEVPGVKPYIKRGIRVRRR